MYSRAQTALSLPEGARPVSSNDPVRPEAEPERASLYIVTCPDVPDTTATAAREHDLQAALDFLHRLVMG